MQLPNPPCAFAKMEPLLSPAQLIVRLEASSVIINSGNGSTVISLETLAIQPFASLT